LQAVNPHHPVDQLFRQETLNIARAADFINTRHGFRSEASAGWPVRLLWRENPAQPAISAAIRIAGESFRLCRAVSPVSTSFTPATLAGMAVINTVEG